MTKQLFMRIKTCGVFAVASLTLIATFAVTPGYAQGFSVVYDFGSKSGDATAPTGLVAQGRDGSLYSTSSSGGANGYGTVFKVTPGGRERVLYSFCSQANCVDGAVPAPGGLTLRPDGHFIGTAGGGAGPCSVPFVGFPSCGTIFDVSPIGNLTTLYNFTGGKDGAWPVGPPILGLDGNFYGTTQIRGAPSSCGTVYGIAGKVFSPLHNFDGAHGCYPSPLVLGTDGNFYGTTFSGGTAGFGVFFQVTVRPGKSTLVNVLYNFDGVTLAYPGGPLVQGGDGNFYGTTGGRFPNVPPAVFKITPSGAPTVLHSTSFTDDAPYLASVVQATDGNFYGTTTPAGSCMVGDCGTLFQLTPAGGFSVLYTFYGTTGDFPSTPVQHTNGLLYGDTSEGGACLQCGVFYSWDGGLPAFVSTVPGWGKVGSTIGFLGQGFTSSSSVSFNETPTTSTVVSGTYLTATVPSGATAGFVTVTTSTGTLTSNKQFLVIP